MLELHPDWKEFLQLLIRHRARFLVVGGHAVAANGRPRYTEDLDVWVDPTEANARRVGKALEGFGLPAAAKQWRQLSMADKMLVVGRKPLRIDVLTSISGVTFGVAWKGRIEASTDIGVLPILGPAELRLNKRASGRPKDLFDLAMLDEGTTPAAARSPSTRPRPAAPRSRTRGTAARRSRAKQR